MAQSKEEANRKSREGMRKLALDPAWVKRRRARQRVAYRADPEHYKRKVRARAIAAYRRNQTLVKNLHTPCIMCGGVQKLCFHHLDPAVKKFSLGRPAARSVSTILLEASMCVSLCATCHTSRVHHGKS